MSVARLALTERALPAVRPVHVAVDLNDIVVRTSVGSGLADEVAGCVVALQADEDLLVVSPQLFDLRRPAL